MQSGAELVDLVTQDNETGYFYSTLSRKHTSVQHKNKQTNKRIQRVANLKPNIWPVTLHHTSARQARLGHSVTPVPDKQAWDIPSHQCPTSKPGTLQTRFPAPRLQRKNILDRCSVVFVRPRGAILSHSQAFERCAGTRYVQGPTYTHYM